MHIRFKISNAIIFFGFKINFLFLVCYRVVIYLNFLIIIITTYFAHNTQNRNNHQIAINYSVVLAIKSWDLKIMVSKCSIPLEKKLWTCFWGVLRRTYYISYFYN